MNAGNGCTEAVYRVLIHTNKYNLFRVAHDCVRSRMTCQAMEGIWKKCVG